MRTTAWTCGSTRRLIVSGVGSRAAEFCREKWRAAVEDEEYLRLKEEHRRRNE
jgi:hypothetical protein